jgi:pimeloyl-ACP methyl ester carboxylesterase
MLEKTPFKSEEGKQAILGWYQKLLDHWPHPHNERMIDTTFGQTFLLEAGEKGLPVLLLFHGSCSNSAMWLSDMEKLSSHYHVFSVDILGEAGKSAENRPDMKSDSYERWIMELMDALQAEKAVLMGNSLGGWMALKAAAAYPGRVEKLVLIAPSGIVNAKTSFLFKSILYASKGEKGMDALNRMICGHAPLPPEVTEAQKLIMNHFNPRIGGLPVLSDQDLNHLAMPVLYIAGENDCTTDTKKAAQRLKKRVNNTRVEIIQGNGHVVYNAMSIVLPFLEKQGSA